jgi:hypothetical protein
MVISRESRSGRAVRRLIHDTHAPVGTGHHLRGVAPRGPWRHRNCVLGVPRLGCQALGVALIGTWVTEPASKGLVRASQPEPVTFGLPSERLIV